MFDLSPVKILLVVIVAVIVVGPDKLPHLARQLGSGWRRLRNLHEQLDQELRANIPDLPSSQEIARYARSPMSLLNQLAHTSADDLVDDPMAEPSTNGTLWPPDPAAGASTPVASDGSSSTTNRLPEVPDDPNLN